MNASSDQAALCSRSLAWNIARPGRLKRSASKNTGKTFYVRGLWWQCTTFHTTLSHTSDLTLQSHLLLCQQCGSATHFTIHPRRYLLISDVRRDDVTSVGITGNDLMSPLSRAWQRSADLTQDFNCRQTDGIELQLSWDTRFQLSWDTTVVRQRG